MTEENTDKKSEQEAGIYEIGFHLAPILDEEKVKGVVSSLKEELEKAGAEFISEGLPSKIDLAYTIAGEVAGEKKVFDTVYFGWIKFELTPSILPTIKKLVENNTQILRHLIVKTVREDTMPSKEKMVSATKEEENTQKVVLPEEESRELTEDEKKAIDESIDELVTE